MHQENVSGDHLLVVALVPDTFQKYEGCRPWAHLYPPPPPPLGIFVDHILFYLIMYNVTSRWSADKNTQGGGRVSTFSPWSNGTYHPNADARYGEVGQWPKQVDKRRRCAKNAQSHCVLQS